MACSVRARWRRHVRRDGHVDLAGGDRLKIGLRRQRRQHAPDVDRDRRGSTARPTARPTWARRRRDSPAIGLWLPARTSRSTRDLPAAGAIMRARICRGAGFVVRILRVVIDGLTMEKEHQQGYYFFRPLRHVPFGPIRRPVRSRELRSCDCSSPAAGTTPSGPCCLSPRTDEVLMPARRSRAGRAFPTPGSWSRSWATSCAPAWYGRDWAAMAATDLARPAATIPMLTIVEAVEGDSASPALRPEWDQLLAREHLRGPRHLCRRPGGADRPPRRGHAGVRQAALRSSTGKDEDRRSSSRPRCGQRRATQSGSAVDRQLLPPCRLAR